MSRRALGVEQGVLDRYLLPAEQPCLQLVAGRDISIGIVVERQPCALLALARHGQMADGGRVDLAVSVENADARHQVAEREDALHAQLGNAEGRGNVRHVAALRSEEHTSELQSLMRISYAVFCLQ